MMRGMLARAGLAVAAVVVLAWLGVMLRDARLTDEGRDALADLSQPGNFARADDALRRADLLSPDTDPQMYRSFLYNARGHWQRSAALAADVTRREPENPFAWSGLLAATRGRDARQAARATAALRRLDPLNAPQG